MRSLGFALAATLLLITAAPLDAADSNVGTWKVNLAKSKWDPGPAPKTPATIKIEPSGTNGVKVTNDGMNPQGQPTHTEYTAQYDGKDYPMTGNPNADTIALTRIDANTIETVTKKAGKVLGRARTVISADGKSRTTTQDSTNAQGQKVHNVIVSDKQ